MIMQELKNNELEQVSGGWVKFLAGVVVGVVTMGFNDGRSDKRS